MTKMSLHRLKTYKVIVPTQTSPSIFAFHGNSQGEIKNKSELKKLLKQLKIN